VARQLLDGERRDASHGERSGGLTRDYVRQIERKIVLIDGGELAKLMIDHGVGVTEVATYTVKKLDLDYCGDEE
jgi:restriction endonuclease Mrr